MMCKGMRDVLGSAYNTAQSHNPRGSSIEGTQTRLQEVFPWNVGRPARLRAAARSGE